MKPRNFAESETKPFVRIPDKNAENAMFRTHDEDTSILGERYKLGITTGARKRNGSLVCGEWSVTGCRVNDIKELV